MQWRSCILQIRPTNVATHFDVITCREHRNKSPAWEARYVHLARAPWYKIASQRTEEHVLPQRRARLKWKVEGCERPSDGVATNRRTARVYVYVRCIRPWRLYSGPTEMHADWSIGSAAQRGHGKCTSKHQYMVVSHSSQTLYHKYIKTSLCTPKI